MGAEFDFTEGALTDGGTDSIVAEDDFSLTSSAHIMFELLMSSLSNLYY